MRKVVVQKRLSRATMVSALIKHFDRELRRSRSLRQMAVQFGFAGLTTLSTYRVQQMYKELILYK